MYHHVMQVFDAEDGTVIGNEFRVNTYTSSNQYHPYVTGLDDESGGTFLVTWWGAGAEDSSGIYAQVLSLTEVSPTAAPTLYVTVNSLFLFPSFFLFLSPFFDVFVFVFVTCSYMICMCVYNVL